MSFRAAPCFGIFKRGASWAPRVLARGSPVLAGMRVRGSTLMGTFDDGGTPGGWTTLMARFPAAATVPA